MLKKKIPDKKFQKKIQKKARRAQKQSIVTTLFSTVYSYIFSNCLGLKTQSHTGCLTFLHLTVKVGDGHSVAKCHHHNFPYNFPKIHFQVFSFLNNFHKRIVFRLPLLLLFKFVISKKTGPPPCCYDVMHGVILPLHNGKKCGNFL